MARAYPPLKLHVPESAERPGRAPDFSYLHLKAAGETRRPPVESLPSETSDLAYGLVRVLDEEALRPYFPLERVVDGMFEIAGRLFGVCVTERAGAPVWEANQNRLRVSRSA